MEASWGTQTTSGKEFGFNKDIMIYSAFVDTTDPATVEIGTDATVTVNSQIWIDSKGNEVPINPATTTDVAFYVEFQIDGLDDGDAVVVEVWTVLDCASRDGLTVNGNIQVALEDAYTVGLEDQISTGNQTNPIVQAGTIPRAPVSLSVFKVDDNLPKMFYYPDGTAYWLNTIQVTALSDGDDTIRYVANGVIIEDDLYGPFSPYVEVMDTALYDPVDHPLGYTISPYDQYYDYATQSLVYPSCEFEGTPGLSQSMTCYLGQIAESDDNINNPTTYTITYKVKALAGVPQQYTCEGPDEEDPASILADECPDPAPGNFYDLLNIVVLNPDQINTNTINYAFTDLDTTDNFDIEPKNIEGPTAVKLIDFKAIPEEGQVLVTWETASEEDTFGFELLRADSPKGEPAVIATIPSASPGGNAGAFYDYVDTDVTDKVPYAYWLREITLSGRQPDVFGPLRVVYSWGFLPIFVR